MNIRITAYDGRKTVTLRKPRSLRTAAIALDRNYSFWRDHGHDDIFIEVDTGSGFRFLFTDEIPRDMGRDFRRTLQGQAVTRKVAQ